MSRCLWLERDAEGRPRCEHGWAHKCGTGWRCREKSRVNQWRYYQTERGREVKRFHNAVVYRASKALYDVTRVRVS